MVLEDIRKDVKITEILEIIFALISVLLSMCLIREEKLSKIV